MKKAIQIDNRKKEDIVNQIETLAGSYTPEWSFDSNNPDIGGTIAQIYASQVANNIDSINEVIERYHAEFINLLDISVNPAIPAKSIVIMSPVVDSISGTFVKKGTRLLSNEENKESVIFETTDNVYITSARIDNVFMTDGEDGTLTPLLGEIKVPAIIDRVVSDEEETEGIITAEAEAEAEVNSPQLLPFRLFGKNDGIGLDALLFYHSCIFDIEDNDIYVRIEDGDELIKDLVSGRKKFMYASENELIPVESVRLLEDGITFCLRKSKVNDKQEVDGKTYSLLCIKDEERTTVDLEVGNVTFSAIGSPEYPEFCGNDILEENPEKALPFSDEISMYQEFFICHDEYFKKAGANVTLSFDLSFNERLLSLTKEEEEAELKIIKKKPKVIPGSTPAEVYIQRINLEYFNGIGWKKLRTDKEISGLFSEIKEEHVDVSFICPKDWDDTLEGAYGGRMLRMTVLRADNCYLRPAIHFYPVLSNLKVSFSYEGRYIKSDAMHSIALTKKYDLRQELNKGEKFIAFRRSPYEVDALYIGLNRAPVSGPVSILMQLSEGKRYDPLDCLYEYSTKDGFKPLKVADGTYSMTRSGLVMFLPPADFAPVTLEGNHKYYLRIRRETLQDKGERDINLPIIESIAINGVAVQNINTYPEQDLFLDDITVGARFSLPQSGILDCEVWVNETDSLSNATMKEMLAYSPDICQAEYDVLGNISGFYVLWEEVERFEDAKHKRVYELDRLSSTLIFGNGINTEIPRAVSSTAIKVKVRCCDGSIGNVEKGSITSSLGNVMYIGDITNPIKGYGGSSMESVDAALKRGCNIISNRRRLVSHKDYINEILSFSDRIDKVRCIPGIDLFGDKLDGSLIIFLLMKDHKDGAYSFHEMSEKLKAHILNRCSITIPRRRLYVAEPLFVDISVTAWVKTERMQEAFEIQSKLNAILDEYLDPVSDMSKPGWQIGVIPTPSQIQMRIIANSGTAVIRNLSMVASYTDAEGYHEVDLKELDVKEYMACKSGKHNIHVDL